MSDVTQRRKKAQELVSRWENNEQVSKRLRAFVSAAKVRVIDLLSGQDIGEDELAIKFDGCAEEAEEMPKRAALVLILNEKRKTEKRKAPQDISHVIQPFSEERFHFGKIGAEEIIWPSQAEEESDLECAASKFRVVVNLFPIELHHFLLVSRDKIPQCFISKQAEQYLEQVLRFFVLEGFVPHWHLVFSSFGAFASVNHLHTQLLPRPLGILLPLEALIFRPVLRFSWGSIGVGADCPRGTKNFLRCVAFDAVDTSGETLGHLAADLFLLLEYLATNDIAHNFMTLKTPDAPFRVAVVLRQGKMQPDPQAPVAPAAFELLGLVVMFSPVAFETFSLNDYDNLKEGVEFHVDQFEAFLKSDLLSLYSDKADRV